MFDCCETCLHQDGLDNDGEECATCDEGDNHEYDPDLDSGEDDDNSDWRVITMVRKVDTIT